MTAYDYAGMTQAATGRAVRPTCRSSISPSRSRASGRYGWMRGDGSQLQQIGEQRVEVERERRVDDFGGIADRVSA